MAKVERLDVRLTPEDDEVIRRAASAEGLSVSAFVVTHSRAAVEEVLRTCSTAVGRAPLTSPLCPR